MKRPWYTALALALAACGASARGAGTPGTPLQPVQPHASSAAAVPTQIDTAKPAPTPAPTATATATPTGPATTTAMTTVGATPEAGSNAPIGSKTVPVRLGWPGDAKVLRLVSTAHIFSAPDETSVPVGKIVRGVEVNWQQFVEKPMPEATGKKGKKKKGPCYTWVELQPKGWVCTDLLWPSKSTTAAAPAQPPLKAGEIVPGAYFIVKKNSPAFGTPDDVRANKPRPEVLEAAMLKSLGTVDVDGVEYHRTPKGLVLGELMRPLSPSKWGGLDLRDAKHASLTWPFGIVTTAKRGPAIVRAEPTKTGKKVGSVAYRAVVAVGAEQNGYVAIGEGKWVERSALRVFTKQSVPAKVAPGSKWLDVDLVDQTVVAYEGDKPVIATLVSTGRKDGTTPVGMYRIRAKAATMRMAGEPGTAESYDVGDIPWAMRFRKGVFFHTSYWHDNFGTKRSHGCVNLAPRDAKALYSWAGPDVPDGWSELEVPEGTGTVVRVRDAANPNPPWYDYTAEGPARLAPDDPDDD